MEQEASAPPAASSTRFKEMLQHNAMLTATGAGSGISVWDLLVMVNMARYGRTPAQAECVCGTAKDGIPATRSWNVPTFPSFAELEQRITEIKTAASTADVAAPTFSKSSLSGAELLQRALLLRGGSALAFDLDAADSFSAVATAEEMEDAGLGLTPAEEALVAAAQDELFGADSASAPAGSRFSGASDDATDAAFASAAAAAAGDDSAIFWELSEEILASDRPHRSSAGAGAGAAEGDERAGLGGGGGLTNDDLVALYRARLEAKAMDG